MGKSQNGDNIMSMMDDIDKYAKIWDAAQGQGIFADVPKPRQVGSDEEASFFGADFFGQNISAEYDMDTPLNEVDAKYWLEVSKTADPNRPLMEAAPADEKKVVKVSKKMADDHEPIRRDTIGKDQQRDEKKDDAFDDENTTPVARNWAVGGKEYKQLEELRKRLHDLEHNLSFIMGKGDSESKIASAKDKIKKLKSDVDELSDSLSGNNKDNYN